MGLDVSHDCWHGAYSAFMRWRRKIAEVAGIPLPLMQGFFEHYDYTDEDVDSVPSGLTGIRDLIRAAADMGSGFPIPWTAFQSDPLSLLLHHSDCEGELKWQDCDNIAARLESLLPLLGGDGGGHVGSYREKTEQFIKGLRLAFGAKENVEFH